MADRFIDRLRGLIGTTRWDAGQGMLFPRCNDIHMWFMSIPIDVIFLRRARATGADVSADSVWTVTSVREQVRPWKLLPLRDGQASETLELPVGTIRRCGIAVGDELCIS